MNISRIGIICLAVVAFSLVATNTFAVQKRQWKNQNSSEERILNLVVTFKLGGLTYKVADAVVKGTSKGDGIIDFANVIKKIHKSGAEEGLQFPYGTLFPLTARLSYARPGNELSNNSSLSEREWFSGFRGKVVECHDRNGNPVPLEGKKWLVGRKFMEDLQRMYVEVQSKLQHTSFD